MKFLKQFLSYKNPREEFLSQLVDREIKKSKSEFNLDIRPQDQKLEKALIPNIILSYWDRIKSGENYTRLIGECHQEVKRKFDSQLLHYFRTTPAGETKTRYTCHLESIVAMAFIHISNER